MCVLCGVCVVSEVFAARHPARQRRAPNPRGRHINLNIIKQEEKQNARGLLFLTWDPWRSRRLEFITVMIINLKEERRDSSRVYCNKKWRAALARCGKTRLFAHIISYFRRSRLWAGVFFRSFSPQTAAATAEQQRRTLLASQTE